MVSFWFLCKEGDLICTEGALLESSGFFESMSAWLQMHTIRSVCCLYVCIHCLDKLHLPTQEPENNSVEARSTVTDVQDVI